MKKLITTRVNGNKMHDCYKRGIYIEFNSFKLRDAFKEEIAKNETDFSLINFDYLNRSPDCHIDKILLKALHVAKEIIRIVGDTGSIYIDRETKGNIELGPIETTMPETLKNFLYKLSDIEAEKLWQWLDEYDETSLNMIKVIQHGHPKLE